MSGKKNKKGKEKVKDEAGREGGGRGDLEENCAPLCSVGCTPCS